MPAPSHIIFDTEYETDDGARDSSWGFLGQYPEIIRIGAVKVVPGLPWESLETFDVLVRPVHALHTDYAERLTGITLEDLKTHGIAAEDAFGQFSRFVGMLPVYSNGNDINQLALTASMQEFDLPLPKHRFATLLGPLYRELGKRANLPAKEPWREYSSGRVHELLGIPVPEGIGAVHTPLRDVWSLHVTIEALRADGVDILKEINTDMLLLRQQQREMADYFQGRSHR